MQIRSGCTCLYATSMHMNIVLYTCMHACMHMYIYIHIWCLSVSLSRALCRWKKCCIDSNLCKQVLQLSYPDRILSILYAEPLALPRCATQLGTEPSIFETVSAMLLVCLSFYVVNSALDSEGFCRIHVISGCRVWKTTSHRRMS